MKQKKFNLKGLDKKMRSALEASLIVIANEAKNHFVDNFKKQGFEDATVKPWAPRKKEDKRSGRNILVKTGDLRRSIQAKKINKANLSVVIASDLVYANVHNEGLRAGRGAGFKMKKRQFIGKSSKLNDKVRKLLLKKIDSVFKKK